MALTDYVRSPMVVPSLKYLGQVLLASDNYWQALIHNLCRAQLKWVCLLWVLGLEGGGCTDVSNVLHRDGSGGATLQVGFMGYVTIHGTTFLACVLLGCNHGYLGIVRVNCL